MRIDRDEDRAAQLYVADGDPTDAASRTDGTGLGGFVGVPPGIVGVRGSIGEGLDEQVAIGALETFAQPLTVSYAFLSPPAAARR